MQDELCYDYLNYQSNKNILLLDELLENDYLTIFFESQGCFHSEKDKMKVTKSKKTLVVEYRGIKYNLTPSQTKTLREFEIELRKDGEVEAILFPRIQINPSMGGFVASPDIKRNIDRDLYTHVSLPMNREEEPTWSETEETRVRIGQQFFVNDYVAVLESVTKINQIEGFDLAPDDVAVQAKIKVTGERDTYYSEPIFLIKGREQVGRLSSEINDLGVKIALLNIHPETNEFTLGLNTRQKDWVIIKAMEKPMINVLWLGTGILMIGFSMAMVRRFREFRRSATGSGAN